MTDVEVRGPDRVDELLALARATVDLGDITTDELLLSCHERGGTVLAAPGQGAVAVAIGRGIDGDLVASVRLLVVDPSFDAAGADAARRTLLAAAEEWAAVRSANRLVLGGGLPFSLWPGARRDDPLLMVAVQRGYVVAREWPSYLVPTAHRSEPPTGVVVRRAVHDADVALVTVEAASRWPRRSDEIARALDHGTCHVAIGVGDDGDVLVGLATHSIARAGWTGPIVVVDDWRRRGVGRALLAQVCRDLMVAEFPHVVVGDAVDRPAHEFLRSVGATEDASFVHVERTLAGR